jgi:signal transduction histidine kinase
MFAGESGAMSSVRAVGPLGELHRAVTADGREPSQGRHVAQFYVTDTFLLKTLGRFIGTALGAGDSAIVIATPERREALICNLKRSGLDMASMAEQGRYVSLDAAETVSTFMLDGWPDAALFRDVIGELLAETRAKAESKEQRVAAFGEMASVLWRQRKLEAALRLEQLWNDCGHASWFSLHCGYPLKEFYREEDSEVFQKICQEHSEVIPGESYGALAGEEARLRNVTHLQQRAQALENEIRERQRAEQELRVAHDELETRVRERTVELEQKNLEFLRQAEVLEGANQSLRQLSARLMRVQDEERRRLARTLHDSTGQLVALLCMNLYALEAEALKTSPGLAKAVSETIPIVNQISSELRTISYLLHPPLLDEMGLVSAVRWYVDGFVEKSGVKVELELDSEIGRLPAALETAIFRVIQECLTNVQRHSESPSAVIRMHKSGSGRLALEVEDKGRGMAPEKQLSTAPAGVGLRGLRERIQDFHGELEIISGEHGTLVRVAVPVTVPDRA